MHASPRTNFILFQLRAYRKWSDSNRLTVPKRFKLIYLFFLPKKPASGTVGCLFLCNNISLVELRNQLQKIPQLSYWRFHWPHQAVLCCIKGPITGDDGNHSLVHWVSHMHLGQRLKCTLGNHLNQLCWKACFYLASFGVLARISPIQNILDNLILFCQSKADQ